MWIRIDLGWIVVWIISFFFKVDSYFLLFKCRLPSGYLMYIDLCGTWVMCNFIDGRVCISHVLSKSTDMFIKLNMCCLVVPAVTDIFTSELLYKYEINFIADIKLTYLQGYFIFSAPCLVSINLLASNCT